MLPMWLCWIGILLSVFIAFAMFAENDQELVVKGLILLFGGPLVSYINSLFIYGFGELIDKTTQIAKCLNVEETEEKEDSENAEELKAENQKAEE